MSYAYPNPPPAQRPMQQRYSIPYMPGRAPQDILRAHENLPPYAQSPAMRRQRNHAAMMQPYNPYGGGQQMPGGGGFNPGFPPGGGYYDYLKMRYRGGMPLMRGSMRIGPSGTKVPRMQQMPGYSSWQPMQTMPVLPQPRQQPPFMPKVPSVFNVPY